jgi:alpha-tubulin suppressor-like RCC1 family protein
LLLCVLKKRFFPRFLWGCGSNSWGQLGDNSTVLRDAPEQITSLGLVQNMAAGGHHSLFQKTDGTLWAAGDNTYGQLGDGTTINRLSPVNILLK